MPVGVIRPDQADDFDAWFSVTQASYRHEFPGEPGWFHDERRAMALDVAAGKRTILLLATTNHAEPVGAAAVIVNTVDNPHLAEIELDVLPIHRRRGIGRELAVAAESVARAEGRTTVLCFQAEPPAQAGTSPGRRFAEALGYHAAQVEQRRSIHLPVDRARLDDLEARCSPLAAAYRIEAWQGSWPEADLEDLVELERRMSTDVPVDDIDFHEEAWSTERARAHDALVAYTVITVPSRPERAYQWATLVLPEHRGRRLGILVKVANLRTIDPSETRDIVTWNAASNEPMIAVNEEFGAVCDGDGVFWQKTLPSSG
jgi:GNAT superfamily N-acetyltransferase